MQCNQLIVDIQVQRFVTLCRESGGSWNHRWNEQGIIAMIWQIFIREENFSLTDTILKLVHNPRFDVGDILGHNW